jgi:uncharacterized protein YjbI with pentapeptide repeats
MYKTWPDDQTLLAEKQFELRQAHRKWLAGEEGGYPADFSEAPLNGFVFGSADLRAAIFDRADLRDVCFIGATGGADLSNASFRGADLRWAELSRTRLAGADFTRANLRYAKLDHIDLRDIGSLDGADLRNTDIAGSILPPAHKLRTTNLKGAKPLHLALLPAFFGIGRPRIDCARLCDYCEAHPTQAPLCVHKFGQVCHDGKRRED